MPLNSPVNELKLAQAGGLLLLKVRVSALSASANVGVNWYVSVSSTEVAGVPVMVF